MITLASGRNRRRSLKVYQQRSTIVYGVIAESVLNRTVSGIEERGAQLSQGRNLLFERIGKLDVAAAEADVFPTERSDVGE
jgi:fructose-1,6-bisphosphatase/inositol monophosphatase family enzyme